MKCEVCGSSTIRSFSLGDHPLCDDLKKAGSSQSNDLYPIDILYCPVCRTAYNRCQIARETLFPAEYHYRPRFTQDVLNGMENLLDELHKNFNLRGKTILDIGCNDGSLLSIAKLKYECNTYGIEPTDAADEATASGHTVLKAFFDIETADKFKLGYIMPDFIIFTNVFAHISDLNNVLQALKSLCGLNTIICIENHYLLKVVRYKQFDTFYHEHPRTYSLSSFIRIAEKLDMVVHSVSFPSRYGGNIRVTLSNKAYSAEINLAKYLEEDTECDNIMTMQSNVDNWVRIMSARINNLVKEFGPLPAKGFPGRSAILYKLLGLDTRIISGCFEKDSSLKIGYLVPGTAIPILPESTIGNYIKNESTPIINNAWHISDEIHIYIRDKMNLKNPIIDLLKPDEF